MDWSLPARAWLMSPVVPQYDGDRIWAGRGGKSSGEQNADDFRQLVHSSEKSATPKARATIVVANASGALAGIPGGPGFGAIDERLDPTCLYSQVPAFSASDRAMIDVLTVTREGRLAVVELKADEDIHLPLQGWITGRAWRGTTPEASSSASDIFRTANCPPKSRSCFWWRRRCICIPQPTRCCATSRPRSTGRWLASTRDGETE